MMSKNVNYSAKMAETCRSSSPDKEKIKKYLDKLKSDGQLSPSLVAQCLVTVLSCRKQHVTKANVESAVEVIKFLVDVEPKCLKEIISLTHASKSDITDKEAAKQSSLLTKTVTPRARLKKRNESIGHDNGMMVHPQLRHMQNNRRESVADSTANSRYTHLPTRDDRFASVTSFDAHFLDEEKSLGKKKLKYVDTEKNFSFTPVYSLIEYLSFNVSAKKKKKQSKTSYDSVTDLEQDLLNYFFKQKLKYIDLDFLISVKVTKPVLEANESYESLGFDRNVEIKSYWPVWYRFLAQGNLKYFLEVIDNIGDSIDIRKTTIEVKIESDAKKKSSPRTRRVISTKLKKKKYITSSRTALHEICSWNRRKRKKLLKENGVTDEVLLEVVKKIIKLGADVNAVCMRRVDDNRKIKKLVREYKRDPKFKVHKPPSSSSSSSLFGTDACYYIWQTPLSLAIRAKNKPLVALLGKHQAKLKLGDIIYPRTCGIPFDTSKLDYEELKRNENESYKIAADLEVVPTNYSLRDTYQKVLDFDTNFLECKYVLNTETLYDIYIKQDDKTDTFSKEE